MTAQCSAEGAKNYFARSDYYSQGQETIGRWGGKGAERLNLSGLVDQKVFERLCDNINPLTGTALTPITRSGRRVGYDFTWSAPKSVSVMLAMTGDERIEQAFRDSIDDTMKEMEAEMHTRIRKGGAQEDRLTGNMLWGNFLHTTTRPVVHKVKIDDDAHLQKWKALLDSVQLSYQYNPKSRELSVSIPDMQLHQHSFVFNATYDPVEEKFKAGQFGQIKHDSFYWQAVQQSRFARGLQELGYGIRRTKDAFEIVGVPQATLAKFSQRTAVIEKVARELGIVDPKQKAKLGATTRQEKMLELLFPDLVRCWDGMLDDSERAAIAKARGPEVIPTDRSEAHLEYAKEHVFERASVIAERRLLAEALRHGVGEVTPETIRQAAAQSDLLRSGDGSSEVTTPQVYTQERAMVAFAQAGRGACHPMMIGTPVMADPRLGDDQRRAVEHILTSPDRVMILRGFAGTGKTTLTREAVAQMQRAGKSVMMLAPSAKASRGVLRDEGFATADTLSRFLIDPALQAQVKDAVIWLDEAGLAGTRSMAALFAVAERQNARIVLAGDSGQLSSVERGSPLAVLQEYAGLKVAEVTDIRRQSGEYREAAGLLARGDTAAALAKLDALGWVKLMPQGNAYAPLAADYVSAVAKGDSILVVCPTHSEGAKVTQEVRQQLRAAGLLSEKEREFSQLAPLHWSQAQRADKDQYSGEELLQFHRKVASFQAGERRKAADVLPSLSDKAAGCFAAYSQGSIRLAAKDQVRVTANGKTKDGKHRLNNGDVLTIKGFNKSGDIVDHRGWTISKDYGHLAYGYVNTGQASQGRTVDRVLIAQSMLSSPAASKENFYVAVTRGRKSATLYTDDKQELAAAVARSHPRKSALELMGGRRSVPRQRQQRDMNFVRRAIIAARRMIHRDEPQKQQQREVAYAR